LRVCWHVIASLGVTLVADNRPLEAQSDSTARAPVGTIEGTVYDSLIVKAPLRGATVYVIGTTLAATTDSRGRFTLGDVPQGDYTLTFAHPVFDSTGVQAPQVAARVGAGARLRVTIATPRGTTLVRASCPAPQAEQTGLLLGVVRDVDTGAPLPGARVSSRWFELTIDKRGKHYGPFETSASTDQAGVFRLCGVPADIPVFVRAQAGGQQSGRVEVYFNGSDVAFRDFALSLVDTAARAVPDSLLERSDDSTAVTPLRGTAVVRGTVRDQNGRPLGNARVGLLDRRETVATDASGRFALAGVPAGTQTLELRALGYEPARRTVVLRAEAPVETAVTLDHAAHTLESVRILGKAGGRFLANTGFEDRRRHSNGWFMGADDIEKYGGIYLGDILRAAPGVTPSYTSSGRTFTMRPMAGGDRCTPNYYLDGIRWYPLDQDPIVELEKFIPLRDVVGVEVYRGGSTPSQFESNNGCGAVVFWTKH